MRFYFGQPFAGFLTCTDFFTASSQPIPSILNRSSFGPGLALAFFAGFVVLVAVRAIIPRLRSLR